MPALLATVYAIDLARLARFYERALPLARGEAQPGFVVLGDDALQLVIVQVPPPVAAQIRIDVPPQVREETPIKLSFAVPSIEARRAAIEGEGGALKAAAAAWVWRGERHLDGHDPEGNVFQLREPA